MLDKWFKSHTYTGFIDGSWKRNSNGLTKAGIGGFIINKLGSVCFFFSGPSKGSNPFDVELEALEFLCKAIENKQSIEDDIIIASDSIKLVSDFQLWKAGFNTRDNESHKINNTQHIVMTHVGRNFNRVADGLARDGYARIKTLAGWCSKI